MKPGSTVIIRTNPHHPAAVDIPGTVKAFRHGEGFGGCDLVDVRYEHPRDGKVHTMPFAATCLCFGDRETLVALADRHETIAARIRTIAGMNSGPLDNPILRPDRREC